MEDLEQRGYRMALAHRDQRSAVKFLTGIASARMARLDFRGALETHLQAKQEAVNLGDTAQLVAILNNLSSLYEQLWDFDEAITAAEDAQRLTRGLDENYFKLDFKAELLLQLGKLRSLREDQSAEQTLLQGVEAIRARSDLGDPQRVKSKAALEAIGWDLIGRHRLAHGDLEGADAAHTEAFRLRTLFYPPALWLSRARLGELRLAQARKVSPGQKQRFLTDALKLTGSAIESRSRAAIPYALLLNQRGRIQLEQQDTAGALHSFRAAVREVGLGQGSLLPALSALSGANQQLNERVFDPYVDAAASYGLQTGDAAIQAEGFLTTELSRASSLRASQDLASVWRRRLPPQYWTALGRLGAEDARAMRLGQARSPLSQQLRLELTEMEAAAGLGLPEDILINHQENILGPGSLTHFQKVLRYSEVLLSFHLADRESYLWAVTNKTLHMYKIGPRKPLEDEIREFRRAVAEDSPDAYRLGFAIYQKLFGKLSPEEAGTSHWLLSVEDSLFELPFAALAVGEPAGHPEYLVEKHVLQVIPGAFSLARSSTAAPAAAASSLMLAVGDPIYNGADPRSKALATANNFGWTASASTTSLQLNRLPGTAEELDTIAAAWRGAGGSTLELRGGEATLDRFHGALGAKPLRIHLATHVLNFSSGPKDQAFVAFGLGRNGEPELLSTSDIALLQVPGALVVMTGCASATGEVVPAAGLVGLTRAWTIAGARAVVATHWPVRDSGGELLRTFYSELPRSTPAEALQKSQIGIIHSGSKHASTAAWAPYQVFGGDR